MIPPLTAGRAACFHPSHGETVRWMGHLIIILGTRLEGQLQGQLDEARVVDGGVDGAEAVGVDVGDGRSELRVIKEVEELCAEVQAHPLAWQRELLDNGEVGVDEIRADDGDARRVAQFAGVAATKQVGLIHCGCPRRPWFAL